MLHLFVKYAFHRKKEKKKKKRRLHCEQLAAPPPTHVVNSDWEKTGWNTAIAVTVSQYVYSHMFIPSKVDRHQIFFFKTDTEICVFQARVLATIGVTRGLGDHDLKVHDSNIYIKPFLSCCPEVRASSANSPPTHIQALITHKLSESQLKSIVYCSPLIPKAIYIYLFILSWCHLILNIAFIWWTTTPVSCANGHLVSIQGKKAASKHRESTQSCWPRQQPQHMSHRL